VVIHTHPEGQKMVTAATEGSVKLKPALVSIPDAREYLGGIGNSKFYQDILPAVEAVRIGRRTFILLESLDKLIAGYRTPVRHD
jgi:hypothetical protein